MSDAWNHERDLRGYAGNPPNPQWPGDARLAVSLVLNMEAGAELSLADGDESNEAVYEIVEPVEGAPNYALSSHFDFETKTGYWRIMRLLERFGLPCTVSCAGRTAARAPWMPADCVTRGHEVSAHGYRWERHAAMPEAREREAIAKTVAAIEAACGTRPLGWHTKGAPSVNTRRLLVEEFGFLYDSDAYDEDLPYRVTVGDRRHLVIPYAFDTNDMRFMPGGTFVHAEDFARYCIEAFDVLWEEAAERPAMMSIGIHPRLLGRPGRIRGLTRFLEHATARRQVWFARRVDIARHWQDRVADGG